MKIKPPAILERIAVSIPDKFPLEDQVDRVLNGIAERIENSPVTVKLDQINSRLPYIEETDLNTPLGRIRLPEVSLPRPTPPVLDGRKRDAMKAAIGTDISSVVGVIPVVGDVISDVVEDVFGAKIRTSLSSQELDTYMKYDKLGPSTYAMMRTFARGKK